MDYDDSSFNIARDWPLVRRVERHVVDECHVVRDLSGRIRDLEEGDFRAWHEWQTCVDIVASVLLSGGKSAEGDCQGHEAAGEAGKHHSRVAAARREQTRD